MKRLIALCTLCCLAILSGRGEDDPLQKVYHSFTRLSNGVRNTFTEDSSDGSAPTLRDGIGNQQPNTHLRRRKRPSTRRNRQRRPGRAVSDRLPTRKSRIQSPPRRLQPRRELVLIPNTVPKPRLRWPP